MSDTIYLVDGNSLTPMKPSAPPDEDKLQDLIAKYSELIGDSDGDLLLVSREQAVGDSEDSADRWSLDHLFVTREAIPVLVEVKRAVDTRLRREVVGQLLEYAANGSAYWSAADTAQSFAETCLKNDRSPDEALSEFLGDAAETAGFWERVESNLRDGRLKMLIVADRIPSELARIVEFMNDQMRAEVHAIELRYFESADGRLTLAPRTIGQTEKTKARKGSSKMRPEPVDPSNWIAQEWAGLSAEARRGGSTLSVWLTEQGAQMCARKDDLAAVFRCLDGSEVTPLSLGSDGRVYLGMHLVQSRPGARRAPVRESYFAAVEEAVGTVQHNPRTRLSGWASFPAGRLADEDRLKRFTTAARDWIAACRASEDPAA